MKVKYGAPAAATSHRHHAPTPVSPSSRSHPRFSVVPLPSPFLRHSAPIPVSPRSAPSRPFPWQQPVGASSPSLNRTQCLPPPPPGVEIIFGNNPTRTKSILTKIVVTLLLESDPTVRSNYVLKKGIVLPGTVTPTFDLSKPEARLHFGSFSRCLSARSGLLVPRAVRWVAPRTNSRTVTPHPIAHRWRRPLNAAQTASRVLKTRVTSPSADGRGNGTPLWPGGFTVGKALTVARIVPTVLFCKCGTHGGKYLSTVLLRYHDASSEYIHQISFFFSRYVELDLTVKVKNKYKFCKLDHKLGYLLEKDHTFLSVQERHEMYIHGECYTYFVYLIILEQSISKDHNCVAH